MSGCGVLAGMSSDDEQPAHQPPDAIVPWTPRQVAAQARSLRAHLEEHPQGGPVDTLNVMLTMLEYTACPHEDCPRMLLEH